ncbi:MAG: hypothetical protein GXY03_06310 [Solirubrobacterales bacterium]|nr:hypothetical protein [Solirubrobacterales bacterium]
MFPRLTQTVLARADVLVELVTLGEYGLDERGVPLALAPDDDTVPHLGSRGAVATSPTVRGGDPLADAPARVPLRGGTAPRPRQAPRPQAQDCAAAIRWADRRRGRCAADADRCVIAPGAGAPARP